MRALVTADVHATPYGTWRGRGIHGDALFGLEQVMAIAGDPRMHIDEVDILGDILEAADAAHPEMPALLRRARALLVGPAKPRVRYLLGNHDRRADWLSTFSQGPTRGPVENVDGRAFDFLGLPAYGLSYRAPDELRAALAGRPEGTRVLFLHQSVSEFEGGGRGDLRLADLAAVGVDYVFVGDYHRQEVLDGPPATFSPGPLCLQSIDEPDAKGAFLVEREGDSLFVEPLGVRTRPCLRTTVATAGELDEVVGDLPAYLARCAQDASLPEEVRAPLVIVTFLAPVEGGPDRVRTAVGSAGHAFVRHRDAPVPEGLDGPIAPAWLRPDSPSAWTRSWADALHARGADPDVSATALRLLGARDVRAELRQLKAEMEAPCTSTN